MSIDKYKLSSKLTPDYSNISKEEFRNLLCQSDPSNRQQLQQYLTDSELLLYVQKRAHLMSMRLQLEMEKDYWIHLVDQLLSAVQWLSKMPKDLTRRYSINWDYPRTVGNIQHRQRVTANKIKRIDEQMRVHSQENLICSSIFDQTLLNRIGRIVYDALKVMICNDLENLHVQFEQKKTLMEYDAIDIHLLQSFYHLHPTEDQVIYRFLIINCFVLFYVVSLSENQSRTDLARKT